MRTQLGHDGYCANIPDTLEMHINQQPKNKKILKKEKKKTDL